MICDRLSASTRYILGVRFIAAFEYLRRAHAGDCREGRTDIIPGEVWASVVRKAGRAPAAAGFEYHERFADVHLCAQGRERIGWREDARDLPERKAFDPALDYGLYEGTPEDFVPLAGDRFAVFFPGELHAPLIAEGEVTKICVKVLCDFPV